MHIPKYSTKTDVVIAFSLSSLRSQRSPVSARSKGHLMCLFSLALAWNPMLASRSPLSLSLSLSHCLFTFFSEQNGGKTYILLYIYYCLKKRCSNPAAPKTQEVFFSVECCRNMAVNSAEEFHNFDGIANFLFG